MNVYLRRDIDYLLAPYSYEQLFLKLPYDYAVEAAAQSRVFLTHQDAANSYWSQQYVNIDTTVDDLPHALRLGVHDPKFPRRWAAVLETTNPDWVWFISDDPLEYPRFLEFIGTAGSIPYVPSMTEVLIVDEPDERKIVEGWNVGSGSKNVTVCSYDIRAAVGASTPTAEIRNYDYFSVGIGEGESRFQAFTDWPDGEEFAFPGLERLNTKKVHYASGLLPKISSSAHSFLASIPSTDSSSLGVQHLSIVDTLCLKSTDHALYLSVANTPGTANTRGTKDNDEVFLHPFHRTGIPCCGTSSVSTIDRG